ncbi:hypothetical protein LTR10_021939 [Elasticomyces elasticus]|uniref:Uncharacterized protein n=1 Tax=Exophiala sideris TaxID=1016849 RepID=A0ABR0JES4_9EURO|nr:hypothetical protein LTR10_021939 [Elasticomyces elasticus]KAK5032797.1 hypothetical protein LTS07_004207 [Exophiala sideris]KAK5037022.1 hypothetical protein LTR13_004827 [Exophiala sideris]KAK5062321.1 hypothetical protein LTR69_004679 [Exophiala sideris]KAK5182180.1 hypothetical protein LTR44_005191 [Eurotiomycetes sp. CCFEE 6388]
MAFLTRDTEEADIKQEKDTGNAFAGEADIGQEKDTGNAVAGEAWRLMNIDSNIFEDLHQAEKSGPSRNPDLQLMGMPKEIRMAILGHLLVEDGPIDMDISPVAHQCDNPSPYAAIPAYRYPAPWIAPPHHTVKENLRHTTNILCVNKQISQEATDVLYGTNTFDLQEVSSYMCSCTSYCWCGIGATTAAKVKFVRFEYPINSFTDFEARHSYKSVLDRTNTYTERRTNSKSLTLLGFLCGGLVNLQKVTLTTRVLRGEAKSPAGRAIAEHAQMQHIRGLLLMAARLTKFHPTLRKAVWRRWSGSKLTTHTWRTYDPDRDEISGKDPSHIIGEFHIEIVQVGLAAVSRGSVTKKNARYEDVESEDVVINSRLVRQTAWRDIEAWSNIHNFALSKTANSSEVDPKQVNLWPGWDKTIRYYLQSEVDPVSAAAGEDYRKTHPVAFW